MLVEQTKKYNINQHVDFNIYMDQACHKTQDVEPT